MRTACPPRKTRWASSIISISTASGSRWGPARRPPPRRSRSTGGLATSHLKLQTAGAPNTLGSGSYTASVVLSPNPTADASCSGGPCAIHLLGPDFYEVFYKYTVTSQSSAGAFARRAVTLSGSFSIQLRLQSFSMFALFTDTHTTPTGGAIWFTNNTSFNGPVHTNGEFRFAFFPTFTDRVGSVSANAWFNNGGSPIELANTENVQNGTRVDAPLVPPDPNPQAATPANFTLGAPSVPLPNGPYNQQGVAVGLSPGNTGQVTTAQIDATIPELTGTGSVPNGIYVPVVDTNGNCRSDSTEAMKGGVYVQGNLDSLTLSVSGTTAVYTLVQGSITTTVTVDRTNNQTTVSSNGWLAPPSGGGCPGAGPGPATRTFTGVPKGWQGPGNANGTIIYVQGAINALSGTLQQNEQTTIAASGTITISGNIQYQTPPNPSDPTSNPTNLLGLYSSGGDIVIGTSAPNNLVLQAVLMAGSAGGSYNSSVNVASYNSGSPRGTVNLLGGPDREVLRRVRDLQRIHGAAGNRVRARLHLRHADEPGVHPPVLPDHQRVRAGPGVPAVRRGQADLAGDPTALESRTHVRTLAGAPVDDVGAPRV